MGGETEGSRSCRALSGAVDEVRRPQVKPLYDEREFLHY